MTPRKPAFKPQPSLADLIDARIAVEAKLKSLEQKKKKLADQISAQMKALGMKSAMGTEGGYRRASWMQCDYKPDALVVVRRIQKVHLFVPEPMITKARVREAFNGGRLTGVEVDEINQFAGPDYEVSRLYRIDKNGNEVKE